MGIKDDLEKTVDDVLNQKWDVRDSRYVPTSNQVGLAGGGVKLEATVLYADLSESSRLATDFKQRTAAKVIRAYLACMTRLITDHGGTVTSFDGDRVMGVFVGDSKNTNAAKCGLKMSWTVQKLLQPKLQAHFKSLDEEGFTITHAAGIDTGNVLCIRAGQRGDNDLVFVGRAPNLAAKLSAEREAPYLTFIHDEVFIRLSDEAKYGGPNKELMWEVRSVEFRGHTERVHRSCWTWPP